MELQLTYLLHYGNIMSTLFIDKQKSLLLVLDPKDSKNPDLEVLEPKS